MLLTTAAQPSDWVSARTPSRKEYQDEVWGEDVLTSDWLYTHETRGEVWGVTLESDG